MLRVLVVDDHEHFTEALERMLERQSDVRLVGAVRTAEEAFAVLEQTSGDEPDVVLLDLDLPGMDGIAATRRLRDVAPSVKVVIVTALQDPEVVADAVAAGACGYVPKTSAVEDLMSVLRRAAAGELVLPDRDLAAVLERLRAGRPKPGGEVALARLSPRETEVLRGLASGRTTTEIATALGISALTVQSHVKSVLAKLEVHSKIEAVTLAWRHGLAPTRTA